MDQRIAKLQQERTKNEQEITQLQHQNDRLTNRIRYLNEGERKKRNHLLITRGAVVECLAPTLKTMTEPEFFDLMEKVFALPEVKRLVQNYTPKDIS